MEEKIEFNFYALMVNGYTASVFVTRDEAIKELAARIAQDDTDSYGIERIAGIWELITRIGKFEDFSNEWMEDALLQVQTMIERKKEIHQKANKEKQK